VVLPTRFCGGQFFWVGVLFGLGLLLRFGLVAFVLAVRVSSGVSAFWVLVVYRLSPKFSSCPCLALVVKSSHRWAWRSAALRGKPVCFVGGWLGFGGYCPA